MHDMHRAAVTCLTVDTGMAMGQTRAHLPQSMHEDSFRRIRASPNFENTFRTAANGQNQRQNGMTMNNEPATIAPLTM